MTSLFLSDRRKFQAPRGAANVDAALSDNQGFDNRFNREGAFATFKFLSDSRRRKCGRGNQGRGSP